LPRLSLTAAGRREYKRALPYWQRAQKDLEQAPGKETWKQLIDVAVRAAEIVPEMIEKLD
jgi:hypothetical protein